MAHVNETPQHGRPSANLPAARRTSQAAVEPVRISRPPLFAEDLVRSLDEASSAVSALSDHGQSSDVSVGALTVLVCTGSTPADALSAAAEAARQASSLEPHGLALAKTFGPVEGMWEWTLTMTVSARDPQNGEFDGHMYYAPRPGDEQ